MNRYRFRKNSATKRSPDTPSPSKSSLPPEPEPSAELLALPPASDFRTSLILPSLSRRFTILRNSTGISAEVVRDRIAQRRANGDSVTLITEEEEDMVVQALQRSRFDAISEATGTEEENQYEGYSNRADLHSGSDYNSPSSSSTFPQSSSDPYSATDGSSTIGRSPGSRSKRSSNNLFGGTSRTRDASYMRGASNRNRSVTSLSPSQTSGSHSGAGPEHSTYAESLRPVTPENKPFTFPNSATSTPSDNASPSPAPGGRLSVLPELSQKPNRKELIPVPGFTQAQQRRVSRALEQVLVELENDINFADDGGRSGNDVNTDEDTEDAEDTVLAPRSTPLAGPKRALPDHLPNERRGSVEFEPSHSRSSTLDFGNALEWQDTRSRAGGNKNAYPERQLDSEAARSVSPQYTRPGSASPILRSDSRVPGYIPGMHRPITPRDMDEDGLSRSHSNSTTPRATSPITPHTHYISQSHSDRLPPVPASPTGSPSSLNRNNSGRQPVLLPSPFSSTSSRVHSPSSSEDRTVHASSNGNKSSPTSILLDRRRPASPLAGLTFQPLVSSRSPTPASTWSPQYSSQSRGPEYYSPTTASHDRHESVTTASTHEMDLYHNITRSKSAARSLSSPALPESPFIDGDPAMTSRNWPRPDSNISGIDMNSSPSRGPVRSPTPGARSPTPARSNTPNPRPVTPARSPTPKFQPNADSSATNGLYGYDGRTTGTTMNGNGGSKYLHSPSSSSSSAGVPPLAFSPLLNSSTSSLVSVSSSYHSWDEGATGKKGMFSFLFAPPFFEDPEQVRAVETVDPEPTYVPDRMHEDILHRFVGLTKDDFVAIHAKLVAAGSARRNTQPDLNKNGSKRRRRPSASQSVSHIVTQDQIPTDTENEMPPFSIPPPMASPPPLLPLVGAPLERTTTQSSDNASKANALLQSVMDSIHSPPISTPSPPIVMPEVTAPPFGREDSDDITLEQRKKALEEALFGSQPMAISAHPEPTSDVDMPSETLQYSDREGVHQLRNQNPTPPDIRNDDQLLRDVERMATAATAALKRSPSAPREDAAALSRNKSTKKIYRGQISTPYLVSATTSVDTIPIPSLSSTPPPNAPSGAPLKLSDRFKRLRGNLRAKPLQPNGEEVTPWSPPPPATPASASSGQMVNYQQKVTSPSVRSGPSGGSLESRQYKFPAPQSTPTSPAVTSPQPGKKGFWDRFRKKPKDVDVSDVGSPVREAKISTSHPDWGAVRPAPSPMSKATPLRPALPPTIVEPRETLNSPPPDRSIQFSPPPLSPPVDVRALQMLYEAANALGLDKEAVKGLVDSKSNDRATSPSPTVQSSKSGAADDPRRALQTATLDATVQQIVKSQNALVPFQPPSQSHSDNGVAPSIVRRTIYLRDPASDSLRPSLDISERGASPLSRKVTNKHRRQRSTSAASASGSVFDRSPTPPPPRGSKRLSAGPSPPLPNSPVAASFNNDSQRLNVPRASYTSSLFQSMNGETTTSTQGYDSLYDMYGRESRQPGSGTDASRPVSQSYVGEDIANLLANQDSGIERIEYANGQVVWSIVEGLRSGGDDLDSGMDSESLFRNRASVASDYSAMRDSPNEALRLLFNAHRRTASGGSGPSFVSQRKVLPSSKQLPDAEQIIVNSAAEIERMIEVMTRDVEAGSFNIIPNISGGYKTPPPVPKLPPSSSMAFSSSR